MLMVERCGSRYIFFRGSIEAQPLSHADALWRGQPRAGGRCHPWGWRILPRIYRHRWACMTAFILLPSSSPETSLRGEHMSFVFSLSCFASLSRHVSALLFLCLAPSASLPHHVLAACGGETHNHARTVTRTDRERERERETERERDMNLLGSVCT
jgi:hypothetical protein